MKKDSSGLPLIPSLKQNPVMDDKRKILRESTEFLSRFSNPVILTGHFPIINPDKVFGRPATDHQILPGIYQDIKDAKLKGKCRTSMYMGEFALETFTFGATLLKEIPRSKGAILVNDWQWVPAMTGGGEGAKNIWRENFYSQHTLPKSFQPLINGSTGCLITPPSTLTYANHPFFFSETKLRNKFDNGAEFKTCKLDGTCAQQFMPLLSFLKKKGHDALLSFIPMTCADPVLEMMNYAEGITLRTVFCDGSNSGNEFWEKTISHEI